MRLISRFIAILAVALVASSAWATDNPLTCTGASCLVTVSPRDGSGVRTLTGSFSASTMTVGTDTTTPTSMSNLRSSATGSARPELNMFRGGVSRLIVAVVGGTNDLTTGSVSGDTVIRTQTNNLLINTTSGGGVAALKLDTSRVLSLPAYGKGVLETSTAGVVSATNLWTATLEVSGTCSTTPCTVTSSQGGAWGTVTRTTTGVYVVNFAASFWSAAPICVTSSDRGTGGHACLTNGSATTSLVNLNCYMSSTTANIDSSFAIMCQGPRT